MAKKSSEIKITLSMSIEKFYGFLQMIKKNDKELFEIFRAELKRQINSTK